MDGRARGRGWRPWEREEAGWRCYASWRISRSLGLRLGLGLGLRLGRRVRLGLTRGAFVEAGLLSALERGDGQGLGGDDLGGAAAEAVLVFLEGVVVDGAGDEL